ncbi:MAG: hypothetical protein ABSH28_10455 [Acidobacteriota bacterium]|jgi:NADPH-dependent glutamate synthase beta subunit-like oxidoreductase
MTEQDPRHVVLIAGGAVAGAEATFQLAQKNVICIVLEQNDRPYGKIEDGLPRWHEKLRQREMRKIDDKLTRPEVHFVPRTKLGQNLTNPKMEAEPRHTDDRMQEGLFIRRRMGL